MQEFEKHFKVAKEAGLGVTMHIAEVRISSSHPRTIYHTLSSLHITFFPFYTTDP